MQDPALKAPRGLRCLGTSVRKPPNGAYRSPKVREERDQTPMSDISSLSLSASLAHDNQSGKDGGKARQTRVCAGADTRALILQKERKHRVFSTKAAAKLSVAEP